MGVPAADKSGQQKTRLWTAAFVILCFANLFISTGQKMTNVTVALHIDRLGGGAATVGLSMGVFSITAILARLLSGKLTDRLGSGSVISAGSLVFALATLGFIPAESPGVILVLRLFQGLGYAAAATALTVAAANITPPRRMGEGMGYFGLAMSLAAAVGPQLALSVYGAAAYTRLQGMIAAFLLLAFAGGFFCRGGKAEKRADAGEMKGALLIERSAVKPGLVTLCAYLAISIFFTFISIYAQKRGFERAGLFYTLSAVLILAARLFCGRIYDRFGPLSVLLPSIGLGVLCLVALALTESETVFLVCGAVYGLFSGALIPGLNSLAAQSGPPERRGAVMGTYYMLMDLGIGVGGMVWGALAGRFGYTAAFLAAGGCLALSAVLAAAFFGKRKDRRSGR